MPKAYRVTERAFINGRLYEKGDTVELEINAPCGHLEEVRQPEKSEPKKQRELPDA